MPPLPDCSGRNPGCGGCLAFTGALILTVALVIAIGVTLGIPS